jgi:NADH-quinone oxidoreductase subunit J
MSLLQILFWFLSLLALGGATMVVASRSPVHSILYLIITFFAISGHYILLNAQFLAIVNIIVYAGAIMVLFLFVVMLMNLNAESEPPQKNRLVAYSGTIAGCCILLVLVAALKETCGFYANGANGHRGYRSYQKSWYGIIYGLRFSF